MKRVNGQGRKEQSGQTMVEFALTLPLLAILLFAIIQYGFLFAAYITLRNASAVGARYATLSNPAPTVDQIKTVTAGACAIMLKTNATNPTVTVSLKNVRVGSVADATSVQVQYDLPLIIPYVCFRSAGSSFPLSATSVMR
jgi:Flp pilus assembly protein TadG